MALNANQIPVYGITPKTSVGKATASSNTVTLGSDTNGATIFTASASGSRVTALMASTDDTVASDVLLYILSSATVKPLGTVHIPASSGNLASTFNVDLLSSSSLVGLPVDNTGKRYIDLAANDVLKFGVLANLTTAKSVWATAMSEDYA